MCVCPEYKVQEHSLPQLYNKAVAACEWVKLFFSEKSSLLSATIVLQDQTFDNFSRNPTEDLMLHYRYWVRSFPSPSSLLFFPLFPSPFPSLFPSPSPFFIVLFFLGIMFLPHDHWKCIFLAVQYHLTHFPQTGKGSSNILFSYFLKQYYYPNCHKILINLAGVVSLYF